MGKRHSRSVGRAVGIAAERGRQSADDPDGTDFEQLSKKTISNSSFQSPGAQRRHDYGGCDLARRKVREKIHYRGHGGRKMGAETERARGLRSGQARGQLEPPIEQGCHLHTWITIRSGRTCVKHPEEWRWWSYNNFALERRRGEPCSVPIDEAGEPQSLKSANSALPATPMAKRAGWQSTKGSPSPRLENDCARRQEPTRARTCGAPADRQAVNSGQDFVALDLRKGHVGEGTRPRARGDAGST